MSTLATPTSSPYRKSSALISTPPYIKASPSRLQSLYSDFSKQKQSNIASYQANIEWWRKSLESYVFSGLHGLDRLVLHAEKTLIENYRVERVGKPIGLGAVVADLVTPSSSSSFPALYPIAMFLAFPNSIYSAKSKLSYLSTLPTLFLSYAVAKPLWWALEQVGVVGEDSFTSSISSVFTSSSGTSKADTTWHGDYVFLSLLERVGEAVIEKQRAKAINASDALYTFEGFKRDFSDCFGPAEDAAAVPSTLISDLDTKVLLKYLERDKEVVVMDSGIVKFVDHVSSTEQAREITAVDRGILELKSAVEGLHAQIDGIQQKIDHCTSKASEALRQKRKNFAMSFLKSRKQLEELLGKRLGALENLESTLICVEAATGDIETLKSYDTSATTLRAILSHPSLQRDSIEKTMEAMAEANADAKEIDEAVRIGGDIAVGVEDNMDDTEIEAELSALIKEAEESAKDKKEQDDLEDLRSRIAELQVPSDVEQGEAGQAKVREAVPAQ
ncbi:hypothetical protein D9758_001492 [Tetrapyrgos nigripes]|uniref:Snf7-domain-containing protein n=1 Tax=Tetrapyrgos nigripes TaxID=182062 RepID=A0A8H5GYD9_9AGAR|nr:hypothetical protein D9758_001492 [Tetrapyrgos nigripes]